METESNPTLSGVYLITGAASGIGAATARLAASLGHRVAIADINAAGARAVADSIGERAMPITLDICSKAGWESALDQVWKRFGRLDVLVNNAAIVHTGYAPDVPLEQRVIDRQNGFGGFWATQILPFGDPVSFGGYIEFEAALYNSLRQQKAA